MWGGEGTASPHATLVLVHGFSPHVFAAVIIFMSVQTHRQLSIPTLLIYVLPVSVQL